MLVIDPDAHPQLILRLDRLWCPHRVGSQRRGSRLVSILKFRLGRRQDGSYVRVVLRPANGFFVGQDELEDLYGRPLYLIRKEEWASVEETTP